MLLVCAKNVGGGIIEPTGTPAPQCPNGSFIVVAKEKVVGKFKDLCKAKVVLEKYPKGARTPSRTIFEVKNGKVQPNPQTIAGHNQAAFNPWYWDWYVFIYSV